MATLPAREPYTLDVSVTVKVRLHLSRHAETRDAVLLEADTAATNVAIAINRLVGNALINNNQFGSDLTAGTPVDRNIPAFDRCAVETETEVLLSSTDGNGDRDTDNEVVECANSLPMNVHQWPLPDGCDCCTDIRQAEMDLSDLELVDRLTSPPYAADDDGNPV